MSKVRDRFETALKLSAKTQGVTLPDLREEMRPLSKSEVTERDWLRRQAQARIQDDIAERAIRLAVFRLLGYTGKGTPTDFDWAILGEMDDAALGYFCWSPRDRAAIEQLRDKAWKERTS